jgi:hypothetical protein
MKQRPPRELQIPFDRVTYRDGQLLTSRDLHDDFTAAQRLRAMHTRFLHATWGIGLGYFVNAQVGDDIVHVGPGYAVDASAREILLSQDLAIPVPQTSAVSDLMLVIGYQPDSAYQKLPDLAVLCAGSTLDPRNERPVFSWRTPDTYNLGVDVPLARIQVQQGALVLLPDLTPRIYARKLVRPHIATGTVTAGGRYIFDGLKVDTSDAGFAGTPEYFVKLDSPNGALLDLLAQFAANSAYIDSATPTSFQYFARELEKFLGDALSLDFTLRWVGVEPVSGCDPVPDPYRIFSYAGLLMARNTLSSLTIKGGSL